MTQPNPSTALARAVIDELARSGVRLAVISPGSRSAALVIAADQHPAIEVVMSIDERSAGFHAVGWAKAGGTPAAVISTSGTATANYLPAVVEANMALTPLVVLTADRPAELRGVGANQAIDQMELYGGQVRRFAHIEAPDSGFDGNAEWRSTVVAVVAAARGGEGSPGPVHINVAFREPTVPVTDDGRVAAEEYPFEIDGSPDGGPWDTHQPTPAITDVLTGLTLNRGLVIAGEGTYDRDQLAVAAGRLGWPIVATAQSGMRGSGVITNYHHLLSGGVPDALTPGVAYAVGSIGPSPRLEALVSSASHRVRVDYWGRHLDPSRTATQILDADPAATLALLAESAAVDPGTSDSEWRGVWSGADEDVGAAIDEHLDAADSLSGALVVRAVDGTAWDALVAASSLPIREVDAHVRSGGSVIANRGASGIDGFVSTALGVARKSPRTVAISGDLSLLHDQNGLLVEPRPACVIVVLDNDGGGLFDELPTSRHAPGFERLFVTPHGRDLSRLAGFYDLEFEEVSTKDGLVRSVAEGLEADEGWLIRAPIDRSGDLATRQQLDRIGAEVASGFDT